MSADPPVALRGPDSRDRVRGDFLHSEASARHLGWSPELDRLCAGKEGRLGVCALSQVYGADAVGRAGAMGAVKSSGGWGGR